MFRLYRTHSGIHLEHDGAQRDVQLSINDLFRASDPEGHAGRGGGVLAPIDLAVVQEQEQDGLYESSLVRQRSAPS